MATTFQTEANTNLHPSFFEFPDVPEPQKRTLESVERGDLIYSKSDQQYPDLPAFTEKIARNNYACKVLLGIQEVSPFTFLLFSKENIDELQRMIRYNVYISSNKMHVIGHQDVTELLLILRSNYLQFGRVPKCKKNYSTEISRINNLVINDLLPKLLSNVDQYLGYLKDSTTALKTISVPANMSVSGEKTLRSITDVLIGDKNFFGNNK